MLTKLLSTDQDELLREERKVLARLKGALVRFNASAEHQSALDRSIEQLDELFLLVIVGEFNSGKSAFINALVGASVAQEGVTPTTAQINVLQYGETASREVKDSNLHVITAPAPILRDIHIVDTPGTNAIIREHEAITQEFVPRSDLVLFVTSADRPFTETERAFLEQVRAWGKSSYTPHTSTRTRHRCRHRSTARTPSSNNQLHEAPGAAPWPSSASRPRHDCNQPHHHRLDQELHHHVAPPRPRPGECPFLNLLQPPRLRFPASQC